MPPRAKWKSRSPRGLRRGRVRTCCNVRDWQEACDFAAKQNQSADGFPESEKWGADTAEASRKAAEQGIREMSKVYKDMGERLYLPEDCDL